MQKKKVITFPVLIKWLKLKKSLKYIYTRQSTFHGVDHHERREHNVLAVYRQETMAVNFLRPLFEILCRKATIFSRHLVTQVNGPSGCRKDITKFCKWKESCYPGNRIVDWRFFKCHSISVCISSCAQTRDAWMLLQVVNWQNPQRFQMSSFYVYMNLKIILRLWLSGWNKFKSQKKNIFYHSFQCNCSPTIQKRAISVLTLRSWSVLMIPQKE